MRIHSIFASFVIALAGLMALPAQAQRPQSLGAFTDWHAFRAVEGNGQLVCFMTSRPTKSVGAEGRLRGPVTLLVTHRPGVETNVVSLEAGFPFDPELNPVASIGNKRFALFTQGETGWAYPDDDSKLIEQMKAGLTLLLDSVSTRGTEIRDTFSLRGFTKAHNRISEACRIS